MEPPLTLAIDQGTHASRAVIFDARAEIINSARQDIGLQRRGDTEVEQDAGEILASVKSVINRVIAESGADPDMIRQAGLATQRSSVVAWDRFSGQPLSPVLSWQDRRTETQLHTYRAHLGDIEKRTGLRLSAHYGATKLKWLLEHVASVRSAWKEGRLLMGPLAGFLLHNLVEGKPGLVDHANASRTLLWNLESREWDPDLANLFGVPMNTLPACRPTLSNYGLLQDGGIPLTAVNGDQTAAIYSLGKPDPRVLLVNTGTGAFVLIPGQRSVVHIPRLLTGISMSNGNTGDYYLEGTVNGAGAAITWAAKQWKISRVTGKLSGWLRSIDDPPVFINTIGGLGSPWWRSGKKPCLLGGDEKRPEDSGGGAMTAVVESIVFLIQSNIDYMKEREICFDSICASGGLASVDGFCQRIASLSGYPVERPAETEATARGIAWQASGCPARWPAAGESTRFEPQQNRSLRERYKLFRDSIQDR